ncbi:MAG: ABC transporter related protein [Candidatus Falkowbacteria bacterium GW2011_GWC2_38_22]|uniref:ABC transporter related protein n=1 Tax=Candidatus Falkowbacteria bacterium GW2011_GWE1_38_31 TaxID=1618638 RepID=A0A0G0K5J5_9BACT|nr:MAG: ABC transporter related protein [Candidatus Falkowbacteria bacterium GW2011_GWF2_38_1205]KKQ61988.1 MAG: ABC transporter related protein [Candidatus Falkowbacteria bacterium GW2011_GWC2_38_22]KKQ63850.1 MAG: ABC transporter related protein [Candidatus Falkowbacteria bacterium GW2011_GWF1_38_22]KKQ66107.1 MAG: ABC transporter related protein [Candidatus Falkowbacteria bacterium GW2011_GWE2_38_254]KKQ70710.1 MAG: ABC transporter related protein [Candidatus Falkowbacteria bacterium GW2011_
MSLFCMEKEKINKEIIINFWQKLWFLIKIKKKQIRILVLLIFFVQIIRLASPYILKLIIDMISDFKPENIKEIIVLIIIMLAFNQVDTGINYFTDNRIIVTIIDTSKYLSVLAQRKMLELSLHYHERENTGGKIIKIQRGIDKIDNLLSNIFWGFLSTVFQVLITTIVLFVMDWRFGLIFLFFSPLLVYMTFYANKKVAPFRKVRYDGYEEISGKMTQAIININTVKSFVQEKREEKDYADAYQKIVVDEKKEFKTIFGFNWLRAFFMDMCLALIMILGIYFVWKGSITIGSLVFVITISTKALISFFNISKTYDRVMESSEAIERLYELFQEESEIINKENGIIPKNVTGQIEFKNVDFVYKESKGKALNKVNLKINSGCVTALIGPSGGGKTTLARMIYRHYDPSKGAVLLDDIDLKDYDLYAFRKHIAIVPQEVEIFDMTVRDNIAYGKPDASMNEIKAAARIANAEEFIDKLSKKYDTEVGERGIKLSGGQRQRVGIARAILANPRILIFDEATSNLDSYSEKLIQESMDKISKGRTTIIIAHRLSTIRKADKIIVLENGKIVEQGNHIELSRAKGGLYAKLVNLQKMGDVE